MIEHNFKKKFGQNFIKDISVVNKIISKADVPDNTLVIEIGPGAGSLTSKLVNVAKYVIAYEIDLELEDYLDELERDHSNLKIIWDDFLKRDIKEDIKLYSYNHLYVIANLPYYITTPIITKFIDDNIEIDSMIIMVQKEVAQRLLASPNNKDYGSLTVFLNYHFNIEKMFDVSRNVFIPKPNVDSTIIKLSSKKDKLKVTNISCFYKLVRDSFRFKRKNLKNNLNNYDLEKIEKVLIKYNKNLTVRAESLSLEVFVDISNNL